MFFSVLDKKPLAFKLMAMLVLCVLLAPVGHVLEAPHGHDGDITELCDVCDWLLTSICIAVSVCLLGLLQAKRCALICASVSSARLSFLRPSGRSPPYC